MLSKNIVSRLPRLITSGQYRMISKKGLDELLTKQGSYNNQLVPQANRNRTKLIETLQWYIPFIPRPQICINDDFIKKLIVKDGDTDIKRKTKEELTKYFEPHYGNKFVSPYNYHVYTGTIVRCTSLCLLFGIPGEIAIPCSILWSIIVAGAYNGNYDDNDKTKTLIANLNRYHNLFKDEE